MQTLLEAQKFVESQRVDGVTCPCCHQFAKIYKRKITSAMAYGLMLIHNKTDDWLHLEDFFKSLTGIPSSIRGDISKLRHWGLLQKHPGQAEDGNSNGIYKITEHGKLFVFGRIQVAKHCYIYNDNVNGFSNDKTNIRDALGDKFNYTELMKSIRPRTTNSQQEFALK